MNTEEMVRTELAKADAGLGSEPWAVRDLLAEIDRLRRIEQALVDAYWRIGMGESLAPPSRHRQREMLAKARAKVKRVLDGDS